MISIALVGLCLTSLPNLASVFRRPLRPEIPLASYFPAWVDSAYGPVNFAVDEVLEHQADAVTTVNIDDSVYLDMETSTIDGFHVSVPSVLTDPDLNSCQEWNSLAAIRTMDEVLVYHTVVVDLYNIAEGDSCDVSEDVPDIFSFAGFPDPEEIPKYTTIESKPDTFPSIILRPDAPEFCLSPHSLEAEPVSSTPIPVLRIDAPVFTPRAQAVILATPLRQEAPEFKARSALALAYEARGPSNVSSTRDAKDLACASRMGFVTPKKVLRLETPRLNKDAPVFLPRALGLQAA